MLDAFAQRLGDDAHGLFAQAAADGIAAEWQRQSGFLAPPLTQIEHLEEPAGGIGELPLVDDKAGFVLAGEYLRDDLVERNDGGANVGREELQRECGCCQLAGNRDAHLLDLVEREVLAGNNHRAVTLANAAAARHQRVVVLQVGVGVERDRGDIVEGFVNRLLVQRLDVGQRVGELQAGHAHLVGGEAVKHECVIGVRRVRDFDLANAGLRLF